MMLHHLGDKYIALNGMIQIFTINDKQKVCYYILVKVDMLWDIGTYN